MLKVDKENWVALGVCMAVWGSDGCPWGPRWPLYTPLAWMKWVEKKDGCPFLFLFVHKLVRQSLCPSIRPSLQKLMRIDFMLFASFWKKKGGGGGHPWVTLDCPEN